MLKQLYKTSNLLNIIHSAILLILLFMPTLALSSHNYLKTGTSGNVMIFHNSMGYHVLGVIPSAEITAGKSLGSRSSFDEYSVEVGYTATGLKSSMGSSINNINVDLVQTHAYRNHINFITSAGLGLFDFDGYLRTMLVRGGLGVEYQFSKYLMSDINFSIQNNHSMTIAGIGFNMHYRI